MRHACVWNLRNWPATHYKFCVSKAPVCLKKLNMRCSCLILMYVWISSCQVTSPHIQYCMILKLMKPPCIRNCPTSEMSQVIHQENPCGCKWCNCDVARLTNIKQFMLMQVNRALSFHSVVTDPPCTPAACSDFGWGRPGNKIIWATGIWAFASIRAQTLT